MMRTWLAWVGAGLLVLSLGLPWTGPQSQFNPGSGPSCIADLSGEGGLICDYIGTASYTTWAPGDVGGAVPARFFIILALVLLARALWAGNSTPLFLASGAAILAVAISLPDVVSGQVTAVLAAVLLLTAAGGAAQRVRSLRSATWGETEGSSPSPSAR